MKARLSGTLLSIPKVLQSCPKKRRSTSDEGLVHAFL